MIAAKLIGVGFNQSNNGRAEMLHQSMSAFAVQKKSDEHAQAYGRMIQSEELTLASAQELLTNGNLDLFQIAGLSKAIACFQCNAD